MARDDHETRTEYLKRLADEMGVPLETVAYLAGLLGPNEDYDGLVIELEDYLLFAGMGV